MSKVQTEIFIYRNMYLWNSWFRQTGWNKCRALTALFFAPQITKGESSTVTLLRPTPHLLRLVWLEEGCTRFFSICRSVPCRCTFQQPWRPPRRVVIETQARHLEGPGKSESCQENYGLQHVFQHPVGKKNLKDLAKGMMYIMKIFSYWNVNLFS